MNRLNYFNRYNSKEAYHEDELTRAYLVLLRHSPLALASFYTSCHISVVEQEIRGTEQLFKLPFWNEIINQGYEIATQSTNPKISTDVALSVLITGDTSKLNHSTQASTRQARYDGVIVFGSQLTLVIENKPWNDVWLDQLNLTKKNLEEDTLIIPAVAQVSWREILKQLLDLTSNSLVSTSEYIIITDFLDYVDQVFPSLNPFDKFHHCKGNAYLLQRRIKSILEAVVDKPTRVEWHKDWAYSIKVWYDEITDIGLELKYENKDAWKLRLALYYGESQKQGKNFFNELSKIKTYFPHSAGWECRPNFHFAFMQTNLIWFHSPDLDKYLKFWVNNRGLIRQHKKTEIPSLINHLFANNVISNSEDLAKKMDERFYHTERKSLNVVPGIAVRFHITKEQAEDWDKRNIFEENLVATILEGLKVMELDGNDFLHPKYHKKL